MEKAACNRRFCTSAAGRKSARLIADPGFSYRLTMFKQKLSEYNIFYAKLAYGISADGFQIPHLRKAAIVSG